MPIILAVFAFITPRFTIIIIWLFSNWFNGIFPNIFWPLIGFFLLPTTMVWYSLVFHIFENSWGLIPYIGLAVALMIDIGPLSRKRRKKYEKY